MARITFALLLSIWVAGDLYAQDFVGPSSVGSSEPLYPYDDQEKWKHGYFQEMPYNHGWHSFRPYNYHHVYGQTQAATGWGMPHGMPYSQQFWHRYAQQANLSASPAVSYSQQPQQRDPALEQRIQELQLQVEMQRQTINGFSNGYTVQPAQPVNYAPAEQQGPLLDAQPGIAPIGFQQAPAVQQRPLSGDLPIINPRPSSQRTVQDRRLQEYLEGPALE